MSALMRHRGGGPGVQQEEAHLHSVFVRIARSSVRARVGFALALAVGAVAVLALPAGAQARSRGTKVKVMTRNLYLGADLSPALNASTTNDFVDANGQIVRDVHTNNFPVRSKGLAQEILAKNPDLVGLQEVSLWRHGPLNDGAPFTCTGTESDHPPFGCDFHASSVRYDYLKLLLKRLNKGHRRYSVVKSEQEFDFEAPTDRNGVAGDGDACPIQCDGEENDRLTMRDVMLKRVHDGVNVKHVRGGHYHHLYEPTVAGTVTVHVLRGWESADVRVHGSRRFRLVNTHLEAFGDPHIREAQAKELVKKGGPATGKLPVVLIGDLNSDDNTVTDGDRLAYRVLRQHGFVERSTDNPLGCCLNSSIITQGGGGSISDFDHQVDHILTDSPKRVRLGSSSVTGRHPVNGFWDSDHAGLFSALRVR
jgi:endonuclease/exonuclease/phosphatase family metal-dependent hydrolase